MIYTFRPYHILILIASILLIYVFTSHYDCGFMGRECENISGFFGFIRFLVSVIIIIFSLLWIVLTDYSKEIKLPNFKKQKFDETHPSWNDFQDFLKERENQNK